MVVPCKGTLDLFDFRYCHLIWDTVALYYPDSVFQEFVAVLYGNIFDVEGIRTHLPVEVLAI